jgi:succinoglycan biosynthesis protein ExoO
MTKSVSVIVAAWNAASYIGSALKSALDQTESDFEIIVVDDGSTDDTCRIVADFAAADNRVRLLRMESNGGPARARNAALEVAEGDWITILDADDHFHPRRLEVLLDYSRRYDADFVADNQVLAEAATGRSLEVMFPAIRTPHVVSPAAFILNNMPGKTKRKYGLLKPLMRRSFLVERGLRYDDEARFASDFLMYFAALVKGCRFLVVPDPLYWYSLTPGAITRTRTVEQMRYVADRISAYLDTPEVARDPALRRAIEIRNLAVEKDLAFNRVVAPLRQKEAADAFRLLMQSPALAPYVSLRLLNAGMFRLMQVVRSARPLELRWNDPSVLRSRRLLPARRGPAPTGAVS